MRALGLLFVLLASSCATPGYLLHSRPTGGDEVTPTPAVGGVALLYDRARWVIFDRESDDGSVVVHYQLIVKNAGKEPVKLVPGKVRLVGASTGELTASFRLKDLETARKELPPATTLLVPCKFRIANAAAVGSEALELVVPVEGRGELREKVWLWKE